MQTEIHAFLQLRSHYTERDFHDRLENGMRLRLFFFPSRFLTFSAFPHPTCSCNVMLYFACRAYAWILFSGCLSQGTCNYLWYQLSQKQKKPLPYSDRVWKAITVQDTALNSSYDQIMPQQDIIMLAWKYIFLICKWKKQQLLFSSGGAWCKEYTRLDVST